MMALAIPAIAPPPTINDQYFIMREYYSYMHIRADEDGSVGLLDGVILGVELMPEVKEETNVLVEDISVIDGASIPKIHNNIFI